MFRSSKIFAFAFSRHKTRSPAFELCSIYGGGRATGLSFPALGARTYTRGFAVDWVPAPAASHVGVRPRNQSRFAVVRQVPIIASNPETAMDRKNQPSGLIIVLSGRCHWCGEWANFGGHVTMSCDCSLCQAANQYPSCSQIPLNSPVSQFVP